MSLLYVVSESDADAFFYALCVIKLTQEEFNLIPLRNRKGDGVEAVKRQLKYALVMARAAAGGSEPVSFLAAMDNDRAPHPENTGLDRSRLVPKERERASRVGWMLAEVEAALGQNRAEWTLSVALATPVEMIEAWIVRARRESAPQPTRHFSKADTDRARLYYAPSAPPPQWKELADEVQQECGHADKIAFYEQVVRELDAEILASRSMSFRMFKEWIDGWPRPTATA